MQICKICKYRSKIGGILHDCGGKPGTEYQIWNRAINLELGTGTQFELQITSYETISFISHYHLTTQAVHPSTQKFSNVAMTSRLQVVPDVYNKHKVYHDIFSIFVVSFTIINNKLQAKVKHFHPTIRDHHNKASH